MSEDISKAWAGIGTIKASVSGLERKMTTYRNSQKNPVEAPRNMFEDLNQSNNRNITVDSVPRRVVEAPTHSNQRTSSPFKSGGRPGDVVFSDSETVSTIPSRPIRDPRDIEEGMLKLKERILKQKESSVKLLQKGSVNKASEQQVRFLDPDEYNVPGYSEPPRPAQVAVKDIVRKRKKATAPAFETYSGFNEAQKPVKRPLGFNENQKLDKKVAAKPLQTGSASSQPKIFKEPAQRKVKSGADTKKSIITTSSWRQGAALTRKVLGNKTQETVSSNSITSDSHSSKQESEAPKRVIKNNYIKKESGPVRAPTKAVRRPKKIEKPPTEEPPLVKARHYNPSDVQQYIEQTRKQRKQLLMADKKQQIAEEKEKEKRLQELFEFQKKAVKRGKVNHTPSPQPLERLKSQSTPNIRAYSSESSDKENAVSGRSSVRSIPLIPALLKESSPAKEHLASDNETIVEEEQGNISNLQEVNLLDTYLQPENSSVTTAQLYSQQRQRMDAIRQTALTLRQKIHEETSRLTAEASKVTYITGRAPKQSVGSPESLPGAGNLREAWVDHSAASEKTESNISEVSRISEVDFREYQTSSPPQRDSTPPEPYKYPLVPDPYSIINVYARKRAQEEKRIEEERKAREESEERDRREREDALRKLQQERELEQERLEELEQQLLEDKAAIALLGGHRSRSISSPNRTDTSVHRTDTSLQRTDTSVLKTNTSVLKSDSVISDNSARDTESLLRASSSEGSARDSYHFTPDKTEEVSLVSPASTRKTLSFSENESPVQVPHMNESGEFYSPGALHRKLRGELARYDTYTTGLDHVSTLEHTQEYTEAQHDTIAMARAMKREKSEHANEMSELQEKLKQDMLVFQDKLQQVQQQTMLNKAETLAKEAEIKAKSAEAALQATRQIAHSQEAANKELINMAQHILKSHAKKQDETSPESKSEKSDGETPYTPSEATLNLSRSLVQETKDSTAGALEADSHSEYTLNLTADVETDRPSPTKSNIDSDITEDISVTAASPDKDIRTEISGDSPSLGTESAPVTEIGTEPVSPITKQATSEAVSPVTEAVSPVSELGSTDRSDVLDSTLARDADGETSPEKAHESFRAVLPSESHRRRMSASEDSIVSLPVRKDSFAEFTLEQVSQYMKNDKIRSKHQQTLLELREEAVKERTEAKLQWLDIKKKRVQRKGADDKMPPLIKREKKILEKLATEQEEIQRLAAVQKAAQEERRRMLRQQREITMMQERTASLRRKIEYAEEHPTDVDVSDTDVSEYTRRFSEYDTDVSSVYEVEDPRIRTLTDFNNKIQKEGREVQRILDLALTEKHQTEEIQQEFGLSSSSRLPRGITPLDDTGSTIKGDSLEDTLKESPREALASTPIRGVVVPNSPSLSVIDPDQNNTEVMEMEERVQGLKEELKKKKSEARKLLKVQQVKKKEALKHQEIRLRKQIQTVSDVIEKQKSQISTKLRQHSPSRSDRDSPKRSVIRSVSSKSDLSVSPDSSRIISVTSSMSDREVSDRQEDGSVTESIEEKSTRSVTESLDKLLGAKGKESTAHESTVPSAVSSKKKDDTSNSISEDLSKYSEASYHKLLPSATDFRSPVHFSLPGDISRSKSRDSVEIDNIKSLADLDGDEVSFGSEKPSIYSLLEVDEIADDEAPYQESPQPSIHLNVKDVLEDLSISSGSSLNDGTDVSTGSYKNLPSSQKVEPMRVLSERRDDSVSEDISEDISEIISSEKSADHSSTRTPVHLNTSDKQPSAKLDSSPKSISEKLASLNLGGESASQSLTKLSSRAPVKHSYTLSFDESEEDDDEIKSLLSNIDESLSRSAEIMSAAKTSPGLAYLDLDVDALTPAVIVVEKEKASEPQTPTLGGEAIRSRSISNESDLSHDKSQEKSHGLFSNLTDLSSPTPASSTGTGSTTKHVDPLAVQSLEMEEVSPSHSPHVPSPPREERSKNRSQRSFKALSLPASSFVEEEISEVEDQTDIDLDEISHDENLEVVSASHHQTSQPKSDVSDASLSASKTMSELKDLITEPSKRIGSSSGSITPVQDILSQKVSDEDDKTISEKSDSTPRDVASESRDSTRDKTPTRDDVIPRAKLDGLPRELADEMLRVALLKMLRVRHAKKQRDLTLSPRDLNLSPRDLTLSPKYTERSPTSPDHLSPRGGEPALFNDTFRDTELESALSLARSCTTTEERPVLTPDTLPPSKITVYNTVEATRGIASTATRHLVACVRDKRHVSIETLHIETNFPDDFTSDECNQGRTYNDLVLNTTLECFLQVSTEYKLYLDKQKEELPPWKAATKRQPRPHWMRGLPTFLTLDSMEEQLPELVVRILGLSEDCKPRQYHNMENILAQDIRDEEVEWTDYDSDELVVKFRIADSIFENLLRESVAVCSAIEARY